MDIRIQPAPASLEHPALPLAQQAFSLYLDAHLVVTTTLIHSNVPCSLTCLPGLPHSYCFRPGFGLPKPRDSASPSARPLTYYSRLVFTSSPSSLAYSSCCWACSQQA